MLGGLNGLKDSEEAETWLTDRLSEAQGPIATDTYCKGDFRGVLFAKFANKGDRTGQSCC